MKKYLILLSAIFSAFNAMAEKVELSTPKTSLILDLEKGSSAKFVYLGEKLNQKDMASLPNPTGGRMDIYPAYGLNCPAEAALAMRHLDGNMSTDLKIVDYNIGQYTEQAPNGKTGDAQLLTITLQDPVYKTSVKVNYLAYKTVDMFETWTEVTNAEKGTITLTNFASGSLPIRRGNVHISSLYGTWANEGRLVEERLEPGVKIVKNKDGVRNAHTAHGEVMFSLDGPAQENAGAVIGAALCYSGNYQLKVDTDDTEYHYFFAGINPDNSEYHLKKGETFTTPRLALTYSNEGLSGASRNFHKWGRNYKLANGDVQRKILLNSWEGVYFDINQAGMDQMMGDIASMGGELFVMDDGWFGDKYPRKNDHSSLGDWMVDKTKLPNGVEGLVSDAKKHGIKFGIWIEPEMANTVSELYEAHPDWIIKAPLRDPVLGRGGTQVVLDLSNPKVQDYVFSIVDNIMTKYPEIDYIKWDANMAVMNHGSQYLPKDDQSHLYIEYHRGFEKVCQRVRAKYPKLTIQACASGGGRANWGVLPYFDEFWVSDDTDALQRVYMQWGTSYFFPAIAMASHISAAPNHQTFRTVPLKYRIDVAMSGRLGMEIQPKNMTDEEKALCKKAIAEYKQIRPIVQMGDIYRLVSPYSGQDIASLMYVGEDKKQAVFYWWKLETYMNQHLPRVKMAGLDPNKMYTVHELNRIDLQPLPCEGKSYSGAFLMNHGLEMPLSHAVGYAQRNDWSSRVLHLVAE